MKRIPPTIGPVIDPDDITEPYAPRPRQPRRGFLRTFTWTLVVLVLVAHAIVVLLAWVPPPTTAFMLHSPTDPVRYRWAAREQIADVARLAVVAAEDQKFWQHDGFDFEAIEKALEHNEQGRSTRGASTISQQVAKNLFLWNGRSWVRKGLEAWLTLVIERTWGKERILEVYLNIAEFGPGLYGVEAASQRYFGKSAARLRPEEAARLAAVLPSPRKWRVLEPGPYVQSRTQWILGQMGHPAAPSSVDVDGVPAH